MTYTQITVWFLLMVLSGPSWAQDMKVDTAMHSQILYPAGSQSSFKAPAEHFTGNAHVQMLFPTTDATSFAGAYVTFEPGARSDWHIHPVGQHLVVTAGTGWTGDWQGKVRVIEQGDVIWCPPDVKHWHGASPTSSMTHLVVTGKNNGQSVQWLEKVTNEQYRINPTKDTDVKQYVNLSAKQQAIIPIATFTATGDLNQLKPALIAGLDAGLSVNEIKEILVHLYAYAGFPRSLNGIITFMAVMEERTAKGIKDEQGRESSPLPENMSKDTFGSKVLADLLNVETLPPEKGFQIFTPIIHTFLKEHLFADIFARDLLDYQSRELVTISALACMSGTEPQLRSHLHVALNVGLTESQITDWINILKAKVNVHKAERASDIFTEVKSARTKQAAE